MAQQRGSANFSTQLRKRQTHHRRGLRQQAHRSHAGERIGLEAPKPTRSVATEIDATVITQFERPCNLQAKRLDGGRLRGGQVGRKNLRCTAWLVLGLVIKNLAVLEDDFPDTERTVGQNTDRQFPAGDKALDQNLIIVAQGFNDGSGQGFRIAHDGQSDRRSLLAGLDHHRPAQHRSHGIRVDRCHQPIRGRDTSKTHQAFGDVLVHGAGAADHAASGVGKSAQVEQGLQSSILPRPAVQGEEYQIEGGEFRRGKKACRVAPERAQRIASCGRRDSHAEGKTSQLFVQGQYAAGRIDGHDLMAQGAQALHHLGGAGDRHIPLGACSSEQDRNLQCFQGSVSHWLPSGMACGGVLHSIAVPHCTALRIQIMSVRSHLIIATRESRLALWQAHHLRDRLARLYPAARLEILGMTTTGDQILDRTLAAVGGKGLFVKELEVAMQEGRAHLAIHSLKDVPMVLPVEFEMIVIGPREDPRDAFVSPHYPNLASLPAGAVVGTSSLRRESQIRARFPHLQVKSLRGNLDTRLRKLDAGDYQAILLAAAGLSRLGLGDRIRAYIDIEDSIPAVGQGALGIEFLRDDADTRAALLPLVDAHATARVTAERAFSRRLAGSCDVPLGAHATLQDDQLLLEGFVAAVDGSRLLREAVTGPIADADAIGRQLAENLLARGAAEILGERAGAA